MFSSLAWPGDVSAACTMLQALATAAVTALTLMFSVTAVALQLASQQFSPRLLREFMQDRGTKATMAVRVAAFVYAVTLLRHLRSDAEVPEVALLLALVLAVAATPVVVFFITHITRELRVDTMMLTVHDDTSRAIRTFHPDHDDPRPRSPDELDPDWSQARTVTARRSGFVRVVDVDPLVSAAQRADALIWLQARPGDHVVLGTPIATGGEPGPATPDSDELERVIRSAVVLGTSAPWSRTAPSVFAS